MKNGTKARTGLIAALDIGASKVCCFIARAPEEGRPRVIGIGHQICHGLRGGVLIDMEAAEVSILGAVHAAEQMAGETIRGVVVNLSGGHPASHSVGVEVPIAGHAIGESDLRRALTQSCQSNGLAEAELIHAVPIGYSIDGDRGIRDPRGMYGERLGVEMHMITAAGGAVRNFRTCIERCHLSVEEMVVSAYASGLAALVEDEIDLGVTLIDMGAGTTSFAVFYDGQVLHNDGIAVGGAHVTSDIARGLSTPIAHAERMKTLYGCAMASAEDEHDIIDVPQVGEDSCQAPNHVPRSILNGIIQPRLEETFELVRGRLEASGVLHLAGRRVVLTGGASQLQGARELAALILDKNVRMGRPLRLRGLADSVAGPAFATCAGLVAYAIDDPAAWPMPAVLPKGEPNGLIGRVGGWIREYL